MSIPEDSRNCARSVVMSVYLLMDRIIPYLIKMTLPFWAIPYFCCILVWKTIRLWKHIFYFIVSLVHPSVPPVLAYAILRGNGQYLRSCDQNVFTHQFYDYTSRKFMNLNELDPETKLIELQAINEVGLEYLQKILRRGEVTGLTSCRSKIRNAQKLPCIRQNDYVIEGQSQNIDCFVLFNFKSKVNYLKNIKLDLVKLLKYSRYHLSEDGYLVYGDYFEKGEKETFRMLFESFDFKVAEEEEITRNIEYAKKLMAKDRDDYEIKLLRWCKKQLSRYLRIQPYEKGKEFHVFILEKQS